MEVTKVERKAATKAVVSAVSMGNEMVGRKAVSKDS